MAYCRKHLFSENHEKQRLLLTKISQDSFIFSVIENMYIIAHCVLYFTVCIVKIYR